MEMPRLSQGGHKVVALSQGCYKLVTTLYKIPRLSQGCQNGYNIVTRLLQPCLVTVNYITTSTW